MEPSFTGWPRPLDMWPLEMMLVERGWRPRAKVLRPLSRMAVARVVDMASRLGACIAPRGGGSNVVGASLPLPCCALLDLTGLDKVLDFSGEDLYIHVEAGARVWSVEEWLNQRGYTLGYHPQSIKLATIGGSIAMLGSGSLAPGIGNIEDIVLWLDVAIPGMGLARLGSHTSPRGWTGPGVKHLLIGSEGGLGVIVSAGLRVRPLPRHLEARTYAFPSFSNAMSAAREAALWGVARMLRVVDPSESPLYGAEGALLLAEVEAPGNGLLSSQLSYLDSLASRHGGERVEGVYERWISSRHGYDSYLRELWSMGLWVDTIDTAAMWSKVALLNEELKRSLSRVPGVVMVMSHSGHIYPSGASLYHTVVMERRLDTYWRVWTTAAEVTRRIGASFTHQHGWGMLRKHGLDMLGDNYRVYCRVKEALDPGWSLNPLGLPSRCQRSGEG